MDIEKLEQLLASGGITQEEFDYLKNLVDPKQEPPKEEPKQESEQEPKQKAIDVDKIDRIVQSRLDRAMAQERKNNADLKRKLERLQREKLTDDELKQIEIDEKEKAIAEREKAITEKENKLYAVKAIKEAGLDDGSDISLSLIDFVMGEDETEIRTKVKAFKELFDKAVSSEVDKRFKENGRTPPQSNVLNGGVNPYSKEQWNLTDQMALETTNPKLASQLQVVAGVKG